MPSYCSHDGWNGRPLDELPGFPDAAQTRFGFIALFEALELVDGLYGIEYLYAAGSSAGGMGSYLLARDLVTKDGSYDGRLRGVISDSQVLEIDPFAVLYTLDDGPGEPDTRLVDADDDCLDDPQEATVVCEIGAEPLATAFQEIGLSGTLGSQEINPPAGGASTLEAPLFHLYNKRDANFCYDKCYSEANLHGPISIAIVARKNDQQQEVVDFSENLQVCFGSCMAQDGTTVVDCVKHGLLGFQSTSAPMNGALYCAMEWIEALEVYWNSNGQTPYDTPQCVLDEPPPENLSGNPPPCQGGYQP